MIKDKIKAFINLSGKSQVSIAPEFGMSKESFNNKLRGARFSISDLIKLADITDTQIAFIDKAGKPLIMFDVEDIKKTDSIISHFFLYLVRLNQLYKRS